MESATTNPWASARVCTIYDNRQRPETTGEYVRRALGALCHVEHFHPGQIDEIPVGEFDLYLHIDDGIPYVLPPRLGPIAWWCIDTHLMYDWDVYKADQFDWVFTAQRDGAERMRADGVAHAEWLPLACDPLIHGKHDGEKQHNIGFVGNLAPGPRADLLELLSRTFPGTLITRAYFTEMARIFSASRIVFNRSIRNDVNMRVFETVCAGSLLMTNDLTDNGQELLLQNGVHLATYKNADDLLEGVRYYLAHAEERELIAARGRAEVLRAHTYRHRVEHILQRCLGPDTTRDVWRGVTSVVLGHDGELALLRVAVGHIRSVIRDPYELIVACPDSGVRAWVVSQGARAVHAEGVVDGWNFGARIALGDQVLFLDSSTLGVGDWIGRLIYALRSEPAVAACVPRVTTDVTPGARLAWPRDVERVAREMRTLPPPAANDLGRPSSAIVRRSALSAVIPFAGSDPVDAMARIAALVRDQGQSVRVVDTTLVHRLPMAVRMTPRPPPIEKAGDSLQIPVADNNAHGSVRHPIAPTVDTIAASRDRLNETIAAAGLALESDQPTIAVELLNFALSIAPDDALAHYLLGAALVELHEANEALSSFEIAWSLEPTRPDFLNGVGVAYLEMGQPSAAGPWFDRALAIDPTNAEARANRTKVGESINDI